MDSNPSTSSQGKHYRRVTKRILHSVIKFCDNEADKGSMVIPVSHATKRASAITGVSKSSIRRIRTEGIQNNNDDFSSPKKRIVKSTIENVTLDKFDIDVIRRTVQEFYIREKKVPTVPKLLAILKEKINFPREKETLRKILHEIGFRWKKCRNKRKIIMERNDIILSRTKYLRTMFQYRKEMRPLVFLDETWVDSNLTVGKCWQSDEVFGVMQTGVASRRIIVLCAGGDMGFIPNSNLIYKANCTTGDYHGQMNSRIFEKWAKEKLIPNLPKDAVIVIDNAPYHSVQLNKPPNTAQNKQNIMDWLASNNIPYSRNMRKVELLDLVKQNRPPTKTYKFDAMVSEHGFTALRLPPYHCDINPIEYVWADVKNFIRKQNVTADIEMHKLLKLTELAIDNVTTTKWKNYCDHAKKLENEYWERDGLIEEVCDPLIISLNEEDADETSDSEFASDDSSSSEVT